VLTHRGSPWDLTAWTDSDDRVRGGVSQSYLTAAPEGVRFHGNLDTTVLGGAGFASQRTVGILNIDVSEYDGLVIAVADADADKRFALTLKDDVPPPRDDGRDQSSLSWEYDFTATPGLDVFIHWSDLKPTYRGRPEPDAKPLDTAGIKRVSFMMRRYVSHHLTAMKMF
jgi:complex I intermediate-associated protein 30 (CIA30)